MPEDYSCFTTNVNLAVRGTPRSRKKTNDCTLLGMSFDPQQRRGALRGFAKVHKLKVFPWTQEAGLGEATVRGFLAGRTRTLSDETYERLADAASSLLDRKVAAADLRGEPVRSIEIPLRHVVGAGDELHLVEGDSPIDYTQCPPGFERGSAAIVRGDSMLPIFQSGDILFFRRTEPPPPEPPIRAVIVKVRDGPLFLKKLLPGTRRGRFHLLSVNPINPPLTDQPVESIARIGWVKPLE